MDMTSERKAKLSSEAYMGRSRLKTLYLPLRHGTIRLLLGEKKVTKNNFYILLFICMTKKSEKKDKIKRKPSFFFLS